MNMCLWEVAICEKCRSSHFQSEEGGVEILRTGGSRASRETTSSKSSRDSEIEEKMEVAQLIAEAELLQQKQMIQNEAEKLKIKKRLAKAKARIQAYNNI